MFYYLGVATAAWFSLKLAVHVYSNFVAKGTILRYRFPDKYALVTGASDGIGKGFAEELCSLGFNVILHGRNEKKLVGVQKELEKYGTKVKYVVLDVAGFELDLHLKDVNVLINNVGGVPAELVSGKTYRTLDETSSKDLDNIIDLNARFPIHLTRLLLPQMTGPSLILSVSSVTARGFAYLVSYSSSKGFIDSFTQALKCEMIAEGRDVEVMSVVSARVASGRKEEATLFSPSPRQIAAGTLARVGTGTVVVGYWLHILQMKPLGLLPERLRRWVLNYNVSSLREEERRSL